MLTANILRVPYAMAGMAEEVTKLAVVQRYSEDVRAWLIYIYFGNTVSPEV
jgi:hypothetical protein